MTRRADIIPRGDDRDPRAYNRLKYEPRYCDMIRFMAQEGQFPEEWCANIGVTMVTMWNWCNAYPEFDDAYQISWHILHSVWSEKLRKSIHGSNVNQGIILEIMRKRFPATYGKNPRNTFDAFLERPGAQRHDDTGMAQQPITPEVARHMDDDTLKERIEALRARRQHDTKE